MSGIDGAPGIRHGVARWERGTAWFRDVEPPVAAEAPWPPLTSDPDAFTAFARDLGADERFRFVDVYDVDAPPKNALAFVVCYPTGTTISDAVKGMMALPAPPNGAFFCQQTIGGTCGTVALLNALLNSKGVALPELGIAGDRPSPLMIMASSKVRAAHDRCAGAAGIASQGRRQGRHFVALVKIAKDYIWLDGKRTGPVGAGPRSKRGAKRELRKLVAAVLDARPDALFSVVALVAEPTHEERERTARVARNKAAAQAKRQPPLPPRRRPPLPPRRQPPPSPRRQPPPSPRRQPPPMMPRKKPPPPPPPKVKPPPPPPKKKPPPPPPV